MATLLRAANGALTAPPARRPGRRRPSPSCSNATVTASPTSREASGPSRSRPIRRRSSSPSSATSTSTIGRSSAKPGRNAWRSTVHERITPRPSTGSKAKCRFGVMAVRAHRRGRVREPLAARAAGQDQHAARRRVPERDRHLVGHRRRSVAHGRTPASPSAAMSSHEYPSSSRTASVCSPCSGARRRSGPCSSNCTGHARQPVGAAVLEGDLAEVVVGEHLRVVEQLLDRLHRRPGRIDLGEQRLPLLEGPCLRTPRRARPPAPARCAPASGGRRSARRPPDRADRAPRRTAPSTGRSRGTRAGCGARPSCGRTPRAGSPWPAPPAPAARRPAGR